MFWPHVNWSSLVMQNPHFNIHLWIIYWIFVHGLGTIYKLSNLYFKYIHNMYVFGIFYYFGNFNTNYIIFKNPKNNNFVNINIEFSKIGFWNEFIIWETSVETNKVLWYKLWIYTCMCMYYKWFNIGWKYFWLNDNYIFWLKVWVFLGINKECIKLLMTVYTCHILQNIWFDFSWMTIYFLPKIDWLFEFSMGFYRFQIHHIYLW
jgi:hypothetical protein